MLPGLGFQWIGTRRGSNDFPVKVKPLSQLHSISVRYFSVRTLRVQNHHLIGFVRSTVFVHDSRNPGDLSGRAETTQKGGSLLSMPPAFPSINLPRYCLMGR